MHVRSAMAYLAPRTERSSNIRSSVTVHQSNVEWDNILQLLGLDQAERGVYRFLLTVAGASGLLD